ncbi:MAG: hypothetical protein ACTSU6_06280 [Candidatus Njordarchaeales archaeon]
MSGTRIAIDNSVLSDLGNYLMNPDKFPANKMDDLRAFEEIIELDRKDIFEIGIPASTTFIEVQQAGGDKRELIKKRMDWAWKLWPVAVLPKVNQEINQKSNCLYRIIQDKNGIDSRNLIVSTVIGHTPYYLTTDYKYIRQFREQKEQIKTLCKIDLCLLSPSEFLRMYKNGEI